MRLKVGTQILFTGTLWTVAREHTLDGCRLVDLTREGGRGLTWVRASLVDTIHKGHAQII